MSTTSNSVLKCSLNIINSIPPVHNGGELGETSQHTKHYTVGLYDRFSLNIHILVVYIYKYTAQVHNILYITIQLKPGSQYDSGTVSIAKKSIFP